MKVLIISPIELTNEYSCGICKIIFNYIQHCNSNEFDIIAPKGQNANHFQGELYQYDKTTHSYLNFLQGKPKSSIAKSSIKQIKTLIHSLESKYDIIHFFSYNFIPLLVEVPSEKVILSLIDSMPLFFRRRANPEVNPVKKILYSLESKKYTHLEKQIPNKAKIHFVSEIDTNFYKCNHPTHNTHPITIENGINSDIFHPLNVKKKKEIIFFGNLTYSPNASALNFILYKIAPKLKNILPNYKIVIIGKFVHQQTVAIESNIEFRGFVDDLNLALNQAKMAIFPIFFGTGIKNKVLETLATGTPMLATSVALEGINLSTDNYPLKIISSKDENSWCAAIKETANQRDPMSTPQTPFTWDNFSERMNDFYIGKFF